MHRGGCSTPWHLNPPLTNVCVASGVIERWELLQAQSRGGQHTGPPDPHQLTSDLDDIASWLERVIPALEGLQQSQPAVSIEDMAARAKELKVLFQDKCNRRDERNRLFVFIFMGFVSQEMQKLFARYKSIMLAVNLGAQETPELQDRLDKMNQNWSQACTGLQQWDTSLRKTLMRCQVRNTKHTKHPQVLGHFQIKTLSNGEYFTFKILKCC